MKETGIFYGSSTGCCYSIAEMLRADMEIDRTDMHDVAYSAVEDLLNYNRLILGISTWENGSPQEDWSHFLRSVSKVNLCGKRVAIFGLGDQENYSENFADALGFLYEKLLPTECSFCGLWPADDYLFMHSKAFIGGKFIGLVVDEDSQSPFTQLRVKQWAEQLRHEFRLP